MTPGYNSSEHIIAQARKEHEQEQFVAAVVKEKERLRERSQRSFWSHIFPWTITITRKP